MQLLEIIFVIISPASPSYTDALAVLFLTLNLPPNDRWAKKETKKERNLERYRNKGKYRNVDVGK